MADGNKTDARFRGIESRSIDYIPRMERHGTVAGQAPFWFTGNFYFLSIAIGFLGPGLGLSFLWTTVAGVMGILFGTLFMACHATQGPVLGLPQMVQSRAQFGYRGVVVPLFGTLVNFAGLNVICALLLMSGLDHLFGWNHYLVLAALAAISTVVALYGYDWLHKLFKILFWVSLPLITLLSGAIIVGGVHHGSPLKLGWNLVAFGVEFASCASYNISYAPYVSDYSRYLPHDTKPFAIISSVFVGASASAIWLVVLGAWLATRLNLSDPLVALSAAGDAVAPHFGTVLAIDSLLVMVGIVAIDNYSGMLALVTAFDSFRPVTLGRRLRKIFVILMTAVWVGVTLSVNQNGLASLSIVLLGVLYLLVPWTSVNLIDYFFVRHGHYVVADLLDQDGIYGRWGWRGLFSYALGLICIAPFAVLPGVWSGPIAVRLGGVDVAWLVGLLSAGASYWLMCKALPCGVEGSAIGASDAELEKGSVPVMTTRPADP